MLFSRRPPGRRAKPGPVRRFPDALTLTPVRTGAKAVAGVGVFAGFGAAYAFPTPATAVAETAIAAPATGAQAALVSRGAASTAERASRSSVRTVAAPAAKAPARATAYGVSGFRAVEKPKPAATPTSPGATSGRVGYSTTAYAGQGASAGLAANARAVYSAVRSAFGITNIGGYRPEYGSDHGTGHAVDVMISGRSQGDAVAAFVMAHAGEFHVKYVIWRQRIWYPGSDWRGMADRGSVTANHYDHVHISVY